MTIEFGRVQTDDELRAVQRLRYDVYVEEMGRYRAVADHANRIFPEPEDDHSWLFYARDGDTLLAGGRLTWGGDGFSARQVDQYRLTPFLEELPARVLAVGERLMVVPELRGTTLVDDLLASGKEFIGAHDVRVIFGCCEPHLLPLYIGMGQRTYADRNINSAEAGYLIPLVNFVPDVEALRGVGDATAPGDFPRCVATVLEGRGAVTSQALTETQEYWAEIRRTLDELHAQRVSAFDGFTDDEAARCLARSNVIECDAGDRLLKQGGVARNMFVVLDGTLEVRDGQRIVGVLTSGDVFGEMAFLLEQPRAFDVMAATDGVRVLSLSEGALRKMIAEDPVVAGKLLLNVSKMLCVRLVDADRQRD